eukprot:5419445-Pyramimonas_sp.AAC.1
MEPFLRSDKQLTLMDHHLARLGRMAMQGLAFTETGDVVKRSLSTLQIIDYWGFLLVSSSSQLGYPPGIRAGPPTNGS